MGKKLLIAILMLVALTTAGCKTTESSTQTSTFKIPGVFEYKKTTNKGGCPDGHVSDGHCYFQLQDKNKKNNVSIKFK